MERLRIFALDLLRRSEKLFKTDMVYLAKGGFWLIASQAIAVAVGFGLSVAMANLIPPEVFGQYKFVLSIAGILSAFTLTGMGLAVTQAVSRGYEGMLRAGFATHLKWSIGFILASAVGAAYYFYNGNTTLAVSLLTIGALNPLILSTSLYGSYLSGKKDFRKNSIYNTLRNLMPAAALVITVLVTDNPILIILAYFVSNAVATGYCYWAVLRDYRPNDDKDPESLTYGKHLSLMSIMTTAGDYIDKILVFHFLGAASLAVYSFAIAPVMQLKTPEKLVSELALPKFSSGNLEDLKKTLPRKVFLMMAIMVAVVAAYIFAAPYIYSFFFPQYTDSVKYSQIFSLSLIFIPSIYSHAMTAHMKTSELYITRTVLPIVKIGLFLVFLPLYGVWGIIISLLAVQIIRFALTSYLFHKSS